MRVKKLYESVKMGLSRNLRNFNLCILTFHVLCNVWRNKNLCGTDLCDQRLTRIN